MNEVLSEAVNALLDEHGSKLEAATRAAALLVERYGETDIAEHVVSEVPASMPWSAVADLLSILTWQTRDNGASIHRTAEQWLLEGDDLRKIQIALHLEAYPFKDFAEMEQVLEKLAVEIPEVAARCRELVCQRRAEERT